MRFITSAESALPGEAPTLQPLDIDQAKTDFNYDHQGAFIDVIGVLYRMPHLRLLRGEAMKLATVRASGLPR